MLSTQYVHGHVTHLTFVLFDYDSPLLVGLDVHQYYIVDFKGDPSTTCCFCCPSERDTITTRYYRVPVAHGRRRAPTPDIHTGCQSSQASRSYRGESYEYSYFTRHIHQGPSPLSFAKRLHRFIHDFTNYRIRLTSQAGLNKKDLHVYIIDIGFDCLACYRLGDHFHVSIYHCEQSTRPYTKKSKPRS